MSFLFTSLAFDIEEMIEKNVESLRYRKNMTEVIGELKRAEEHIQLEFAQYDHDYPLYADRFEELIVTLDIEWNFNSNQELFDDANEGTLEEGEAAW